MAEMNYWAILAAAVSSFVIGAIWYAPPIFGKAWQRAAGLSEEKVAKSNPVRIFGGALVLSLIAAFVFAMFLGPKPAIGFALGAGFSAGLCWVAASFGINYLFEHKSLKLFLINGGYHTVQFTVIGLVLGLWH
jgi:hypothetical protein